KDPISLGRASSPIFKESLSYLFDVELFPLLNFSYFSVVFSDEILSQRIFFKRDSEGNAFYEANGELKNIHGVYILERELIKAGTIALQNTTDIIYGVKEVAAHSPSKTSSIIFEEREKKFSPCRVRSRVTRTNKYLRDK